MKGYIVSDPKILGGRPVIKGTRIPVGQIITLLKNGFTLEAINQGYPHLNIKTLSGTIDEVSRLVDRNASQVL